MIPQHIVDHIHSPVFCGLGTRDARLRPHHATPVGAVAEAASGNIIFFLPDAVATEVLPDLEDNGRVAFSCGNPMTHATYQFKGRFLSARPTVPDDLAIIRHCRDELAALSIQCGYPEPLVRALVYGFAWQPTTAIVFRPLQIFIQTPGPGAGQLVHTLEEQP